MKVFSLILLLIFPMSIFSQTNQKESISITYRGNIEGGYTVGIGDYDAGRVDISTSHGILMYGYLFTGIGVGWHYYHEGETSLIPLFFEAKTDLYITEKKTIPIIGIKAGYTFNADDSFSKVGKLIAPYVGVRHELESGKSIYLTTGYTAQWIENDIIDNINAEGITLKLGFYF